MNLSACIFDMDELLLASVPQWRGAIDRLLEAIEAEWTPELAALYTGKNAPDVAGVIHREVNPALSVEECVRILRDELLQRFNNDALSPMPGAVECVRRISAVLPCAVASGSPLECIEAAMETLDLTSCFNVMLSSESVPRGKPFPDVFLAAAKALRIEPTECVVFEDSLAGVKAARAARMKVVAVPSGYDRDEIARLADCVLSSLDEVRLEQLAEL
jgi:HAD superfamily hydrolase (TIGR01509 family)